jgi:predicted dinucleotide-binding enzyme
VLVVTTSNRVERRGEDIMTTVSIIGNGNMGTAIGGIVAAGGNTVEYVGRDASEQVTGDIVILAVPYPSVAEIVEARGEQLAGKVVVDITNPLNFETFDSLVVPADGSAAAELAAKLPESRVLKAFNTNFAATLAARTVGGAQPTTVLVAGDDDLAKQALIDVVRAGGLAAVDAGRLSRARELESVGFLQLTLAVQEKVGWNAGVALVA